LAIADFRLPTESEIENGQLKIENPYGRPAVYTPTSGNLYSPTAADERLREKPRSHYADYIDLLSPSRFTSLVSECRAAGSRGQPQALLEQKADYVAASHFRPQFLGTDTTYGAAALPLIENALGLCNLRGYLFDWKTTWRLAVPALATDGSIYVLLTQWGETGWPAVQILEAHRIGQRDHSKQVVGAQDARTQITDADGSNPRDVRGAYVGLRICGGHIYNSQGTEVAYRVLGPDPQGTEDRDISARDLFRVARPRFYSEGRTAPELAAAVLDFLALGEAQTAQLDQQTTDAKLTVVETNATGKADPMARLTGMDNPNALDGTPTQVIDRGEWRYVKSGTGALTPWQSQRPSDQWMNFDARVSARAAASLRWRAEMLDPTALRGAATRAFQDQINTAIQETYGTIEKAATRTLRYFVAKLSGAPLNVLPLHPEAARWGIAPPPWFEVDRASAKYDLADVAAGRVSMSTLHQRDGSTTHEVYLSRGRAYLEAQTVATKMGVPLNVILGDLNAATSISNGAPVPTVPVDPSAPATP
jgi:hypothetical protein